MGKEIIKYMVDAERISLQAKMKFVMYMGLTSAEASVKPDSSEMLQKCEAVLARIKAEFRAQA